MIDNEKALTLLQTSPQEKYIQVSDKEAVELLCMLDDIIAINAMPKFDPPLLAVDSVEDDDDSSNDDSTVLLAAIKIPAMVFVVAVLGALMTASLNNPITIALYPYITTIITFLGTVPALKDRFNKMMSRLFTPLEQIDNTFTPIAVTIDAVGKSVHQLEETFQAVLAPMKLMLDQAKHKEMKSMLLKLDPDIDIPDTKDLEEELGDANAKIHDVVNDVSISLGFVKYIPNPAQLQPLFDRYIVHPVLTFFLLTQLLAVYHQQRSSTCMSCSHDVDDDDITNTLEAAVNATAVNNAIYDDGDDNETFADQLDDLLHLITAALTAFVGAVFQIVVLFVVTEKLSIFEQINEKTLALMEDMTSLLTDTVEPMFTEVLLVSMSKVRNQFLDLIQKVEKIEGLMKKVKAAGRMGEMKIK